MAAAIALAGVLSTVKWPEIPVLEQGFYRRSPQARIRRHPRQIQRRRPVRCILAPKPWGIPG